MTNRNTVARAFELAREGRCRTIEEIKRKLSDECFEGVHEHLSGTSIKKQLIEAMKMLD